MIRIVMPDPLIWQAGIEYGLQALAQVQKKNTDFICYLRDKGPFLEAVAFAVYQLDLKSRVQYVKNIKRYMKTADTVLLPRVYPLEHQTISKVLEWGGTVITSDPAISLAHARLITFPRRNWHTMANILTRLSLT